MYNVLSIVRCTMTILNSGNFQKHYTLLLLFLDIRGSFVTDSSDSMIIKNI